MMDPKNVPAVDIGETLARYILDRKHFRPSTNTVTPLLFVPYKHVDLSVNRHRECSEKEIWDFGIGVAEYRQKKFLGRCDVSVEACSFKPLRVVAKPIKDHPTGVPDNPNHADIEGYPPAREDQLALALKIAEKASDRIEPPKGIE